MIQERPLLNEAFHKRISRRGILKLGAAATLAPFDFSEKNKFANKLKENRIRSDLQNLLVTKESLESNNTYPKATADVVDASGTVIRQYVINGEGLFSSHWDEQKRRYTAYARPKTLLPMKIPTSLIVLPDDKTVIVAGINYEQESSGTQARIAVSSDRGENFDENIIIPGGETVIFDGQLIPGTLTVLFYGDASGLGDQYTLFDTKTKVYKILHAKTLRAEDGETILSMLPVLDNISLSPDGKTVIVDGAVYAYDPFPQYNQYPISVAAIGEAHINLTTGMLEDVSYNKPTLTEPRTVSFERDEQGDLVKMYVMSSIPQREMHVVDVKKGDKQVIPFEPFDAYLKDAYGKGEWEAQFIRLQRIRETYVATGTTLLHDAGNTYNKTLTAFWPVGSDPAVDKDSVSLRVIDTDPDSFGQAIVVASAREKKLKGGLILEEIIPQFGLAAIPIDEKGQPLGKEILFPNNGIQS